MTIKDKVEGKEKGEQNGAIPVTTAVELDQNSGDSIPTISIPSQPVHSQSMERDSNDVVVAKVHKPAPGSKVGINMRTDRQGRVFVSSLSSRGLLAQNTDLERSMRLVTVNGVDVQDKRPSDVRAMILEAEEEVTIVAAKPASMPSSNKQQRNGTLGQEPAQARGLNEHRNNGRNDNCFIFCTDCCIWCPFYCDPQSQHGCCQACCLCCESGCSAMDNNCDCDGCEICCQNGCQFFGCCDLSCCECFFGMLGAVSV